jgi:hypothetical protein
MEDKADLPSPTPHPLTPSQGDIVSPWFTWYATSLPRSAVVGLGTARREIPPSCPDSPVAKSVYAGQDVRDDALPQPSSRTLCRLTRTWSPAHLAKRRDLSACGRVAPELRLAPSSCDTAIPYETLHFLRVSCWIAARHVRRIKKTPRSNVPLRGGQGARRGDEAGEDRRHPCRWGSALRFCRNPVVPAPTGDRRAGRWCTRG